jgi:FkbM family methyltransferase
VRISKNGKEFVVGDQWLDWWPLVGSGEWEPYTFNILDKFLSPSVTYLDIGAWIGPTVLYASTICQQCYALEPDPVAYEQLNNNILSNSINNIRVFNEAILDYDGNVMLGSENLGNSMTRVSHRGSMFSAPCRTLESFISAHNITAPLFIKMDVEGAEELILKSPFFAQFKPTLYVSLHPFWFQNSPAAWETIRQVGQLYEHRYDVYLNEIPLPISDQHLGLVFTNQ